MFNYTAFLEIFVRSWCRLTVVVMISCTVENKEVLAAKSFLLDCNRLASRVCKSKTIKVPKLNPVKLLHSPLSMVRSDHLKLPFVGNFSKSLSKDRKAFLLSF